MYNDYEVMLKDQEINTIDIATPTFLHIPMTISAAKAGKHIHCQKPFCRSVIEGESARQAVRQSNVKLVGRCKYVNGTAPGCGETGNLGSSQPPVGIGV